MWKSNNPSLQVLTQSTVSGIGVSRQQKPKTSETSTNVSATLFHNTTKRVHASSMWLLITLEALCTAGLLRSEWMHTCSKFGNLIIYPAKTPWNRENKLDLKNMSGSSSNRPKTLQDMQGHAKVCKNNSTCRNIQKSHKMHRSCISSIQVSCKYCSHCRHHARKLQITDISPEFCMEFVCGHQTTPLNR